MASCGGITIFVYLVVMLMSLVISAHSQTTNTAGHLLTGLKIGSINSVRNLALLLLPKSNG